MFRYYLKLGALSIRGNPVLSALMIAAIAIGIGACMTIITIHHMMGSNPIPHKSAQLRHVQMDSWSDVNPYDDGASLPIQVTYTDARNLLAAEKAVRQIASFASGRVVEPDDPDELPFTVDGRATSRDFFAMFDVPFKYGSAWPD